MLMNAAVDKFEVPGAGQWSLDRSHYPGGTTSICKWLMIDSFDIGMRRVFKELGVPADTLQVAFVNGFMYTRLRPLISADKPPKKLPPLPILKLATRLHPEFRKRNRTAARVIRERPWLAVLARWEREIRPQLHEENQSFANVAVAELDARALADHVAALLAHCRRTFELHFWLHGYDLGPIAYYLVEASGCGIAPVDAVKALEGASPSTSIPRLKLQELRGLLNAGGSGRPTSLQEVAAVSPQASMLLDAYLAERGQHLVTGYDLDSYTLAELPTVVLASILDSVDHEPKDGAATGAALVARVSPERRAAFEQCLSDARAVMDLRDDNGPNTIERPIGLLRRALLEAGKAHVASGRVQQREHLFELAHDEVVDFIAEGRGPTAAELSNRATFRQRQAELDPPAILGQLETPPPLEVLPPALRRGVQGVQMVLTQMGMDGVDASSDPLVGIGVGSTSYRGPVRRVATSEEAISTMEPGDVLVVRATSPAFNAVLTIAGAVITTSGGPLSHAAVLARELGIPAIIGARGALDLPNGAEVEVDPVSGRVRLID